MNGNVIRLVLKGLAIIAFVLSLIWAYTSFSYEPAIAAVVSLGSLIALFLTDPKPAASGVSQRLQAGDHSRNYQAAGDITIGQKDPE